MIKILRNIKTSIMKRKYNKNSKDKGIDKNL